MSEDQRPIFTIEKVYVRDMSLEIPNAPQIFLEREAPQIDVQMQTRGGQIAEDGMYESVLTVTITSRIGDKVMFLVEVQQAGIFRIRNIPQSDIEPVLGIGCPNILFPYLREAVSTVVSHAGFPPVMLNPVNFETLYYQGKQQAEANGAVAEKVDGETKTTH